MLRRKRRYKKNSNRKSVARRFIRSIFAVVILSGLLFGVSLYVKKVASTNNILVELAHPITTRLGIEDEKVGEVAGEFVERVSQTGINTNNEYYNLFPTQKEDTSIMLSDTASASSKRAVLTIGIIADSHEDLDALKKAVQVIDDQDVDFAVHLGDLSNVGDINMLEQSKDILDDSTTKWYVLPGDHDLAQSGSRRNFLEIYDEPNNLVEEEDISFLLFDNSANFTPLKQEELDYFEQNISSADFVMFSQPLYHPMLSRVMGRINDEENAELLSQNELLLEQIRNSDVQAIIAADHHLSSNYKDEQKEELYHIVVSAVYPGTSYVKPKLSLLKIYDVNDFHIEEIPIK